MNLKEQMQKKAIWKFYLPSYGIFEREVRRFFAVPAQTIFAPLGSALIYFALFGFALGKFIHSGVTHGFSYIIFLIPGIIAMEIVNASFQNPISSIMVAKWTGTLIDILMSPVSPLGLWLAYIGGAFIRSLIVAFSVFLAGSLCAWEFVPVNWFLFIFALVTSVGIFAGFGVIIGSFVKTWEQVGIVVSFILQPLTFFSGVFFSFESFPNWLQTIKYFNPIFYIVSMFRYSILGYSDALPLVSFGVSILFLIITFLLSVWALKRGFGLRN